MGVLRRLWGGYLRQLERRPIVVKATSSAITFSLTDALVSNDARASIVFLPLPPPRPLCLHQVSLLQQLLLARYVSCSR